ncbi:MAG: hypothetical protein HYX53_16220 [Chloroflexi bacterium]|nr:hypothetical protein [Chloroflexota bacterium]
MSGRTCLLLAGHGSHFSPDSSTPIRDHARRIRELRAFDEVRVGFWKEEPSLARALDGCTASEVVVVPVFISDGFFTQQVLPRELRLDGPDGWVDGRHIRITPAIGSHPALAGVIVQRALEAGAQPGDAVAVLGHGTPGNPNSERNIYKQAGRVRAMGKFAEVVTLFLDQEPNLASVFDATNARTVVAAPLFVADGWHVGETIPAELGVERGEARDGQRRLRYAAAAGTHPGIAGVILQLAGSPEIPAAGAVAARTAPGWLECAWVQREPFALGEVTVRFADGAAGVEGPDPGPAMSLSDTAARLRHDSAGRYRPLPSAFGLPGGWRVRCASAAALAAAIDAVYPFATTHVQQHRDGSLRVVPVDEVFARQTGRYRVAAELDAAGRTAAVAALCSRCVKTPVWTGPPAVEARLPTPNAQRPTPPGQWLPCPEPCSVMLSLCREAALWQHDPPAAAPADDAVPFAAFDQPGNAIREDYLRTRYAGSDVQR